MAEYLKRRHEYTADTALTLKEVEQSQLMLLLASSFSCHMSREGLDLS